MQDNVPIYRAVASFPPGLDEIRLAVVDDDQMITEQVWRPEDNYQPGPATWDWRLHALGYERTTRWEQNELGFRADVKAIVRGDD